MTKKEYEEKIGILNTEIASIRHKISEVTREYIDSLNVPYKQFYHKKVLVEFTSGLRNSISTITGYWDGIKEHGTLLELQVIRPKKDGSMGKLHDWAFFDEIVSIKEIE